MDDEDEIPRRSRRQRVILSSIFLLLNSFVLESLLLILELLRIQQDQATLINLQLLQMGSDREVITNYLETVSMFGDVQFQENFRLTRTAFELLEGIVSRVIWHRHTGRPFTPIRKQLLATIWLLGTPDSYRSISERFGIQKSVLYFCALRIVKILCKISKQFIKWPTETEQNRIKRKFLEYGIPGVIGAVDGSFIYCSEPKENSNAYNTRKCRHAIQLQAICIPSLEFIDIFTGYPGSVGDLRVFRNSDIYKEIERNHHQFFPQNDHILGDKAYPLKTWCITPYKDDGTITPEQRQFNTLHSRARCVIERSFSLLKGRFRRLKHLEIIRHDLAPYYILASCVLHNMCLSVGGENIQRYLGEGREHTNNDRDNDIVTQENPIAAINKRDYLCNLIVQ